MNYAISEHHSFKKLFQHCKVVCGESAPISLLLGLLALFFGESLRRVFEAAAFEQIAQLTLPLTFSFLVTLAGAVTLFSGDKTCFYFTATRAAGNYFARLGVTLSAGMLGVCIGIYLPYAFSNGLYQASLFLLVSAQLTLSLVATCHLLGIWLYSSYPEFVQQHKVLLGLGGVLIGFELASLHVFEQLQSV